MATQAAGGAAATLTGSAIETVARGFEVVGVSLLVLGTLVAAGLAITRLVRRKPARWSLTDTIRALRSDVGRAMLLGLEFLVVADIVNTVVIETTFTSVATLGLLVLVRTFLSWSIDVEIMGMWPWNRAATRVSSPSSVGSTER